MAPTETKFYFSRLVVSAAVFISLCVPVNAVEGRRCYWCGPLAEQVHRSQRAQPCSGQLTQDTVCDPGFPYCAVVATSPPYVESRYCVKLYQDECYLLYCNSTRTWRMTCPCRGDLCNGPNTEREEDAFAGLAKVVAKTQNTRIKRALIPSAGFLSMNTNRKSRIDNTTIEENINVTNYTTGNLYNEEIYHNINKSHPDDDSATKEFDSANIDTQKTDASDSTFSDDNESKKASPAAEVEVNIENETDSPNKNANEIIKNNDYQINETSIQIDLPSINAESGDLKTEIILMSNESSELINTAKGSDFTNTSLNPQITIESDPPVAVEVKTMVEITTEMTQISTTETKSDKNIVKPSEQLPTARALQHDETLTDKTTQGTSMSTSTTLMMVQHVETTTPVSKPRNNTGVRIDAHILTLFVCIILVY